MISDKNLPLYELDPGAAYQQYLDNEERRYQADIEDALCSECVYCLEPVKNMFTDKSVAYCEKWVEDFIHTFNTPKDFDCEVFSRYR